MAEQELRWAPIPPSVLNIDTTLLSGQCFRWVRTSDGEWLGTIRDSVLRLLPTDEGFWWQTYPARDAWEIVADYFALEVDLVRLQAEWITAEPRIASAIERFPGLRILRQDPTEVLFSFLCACCNTIVKITRSIKALEKRVGEPIGEVCGNLFYRFPKAAAIAEMDERTLRADLWGFRAPRLIEIARIAVDRGPDWVNSLRLLPYASAHRELCSLHGIGEKIADCICIFGLGFDQAVPVDTHVWKAAVSLCDLGPREKSLTPKSYAAYAESLRSKFGSHAGWAQQYLFMQYLRAGSRPIDNLALHQAR